MTRREFGAVALQSAAILDRDDLAPDCPTCTGLIGGTLECVGCGRMVAAKTGDPVFDLNHQAGRWLEVYDSGRGFSDAVWHRIRSAALAEAEQASMFPRIWEFV